MDKFKVKIQLTKSVFNRCLITLTLFVRVYQSFNVRKSRLKLSLSMKYERIKKQIFTLQTFDEKKVESCPNMLKLTRVPQYLII